MTGTEWNFTGLRALFINCTLKRSPEISNTQALVDASRALMERHGVQTFHYVGGRFSSGQQTGTPGMLYAAGWGIVALMALRLLLRRIAEVKAYRAKSGDMLLPND